MYYKLKVAGIERDLPLCPLGDEMMIAAFVMFGDVELTEECARELCRLVPEHDVMLTAESKGIPLICSMARMLGENKYILARKSVKLYMRDVRRCEVRSITTAASQTLYIDGYDAEYMKGKKVLIVDDVVSTGESMRALEKLVSDCGGYVAGKMAVLCEGDAYGRDDVVSLGYLPLFDKEGRELGK